MKVLPQPDSSVICCVVEDGAVLLSTVDEVYYGLNQVGLRIWQLLPPAHADLDELCGVLSREYPGVAMEILREDAEALLTDLAANGLVVSRGS